jgi:hypothetical protein
MRPAPRQLWEPHLPALPTISPLVRHTLRTSLNAIPRKSLLPARPRLILAGLVLVGTIFTACFFWRREQNRKAHFEFPEKGHKGMAGNLSEKREPAFVPFKFITTDFTADPENYLNNFLSKCRQDLKGFSVDELLKIAEGNLIGDDVDQSITAVAALQVISEKNPQAALAFFDSHIKSSKLTTWFSSCVPMLLGGPSGPEKIQDWILARQKSSTGGASELLRDLAQHGGGANLKAVNTIIMASTLSPQEKSRLGAMALQYCASKDHNLALQTFMEAKSEDKTALSRAILQGLSDAKNFSAIGDFLKSHAEQQLPPGALPSAIEAWIKKGSTQEAMDLVASLGPERQWEVLQNSSLANQLISMKPEVVIASLKAATLSASNAGVAENLCFQMAAKNSAEVFSWLNALPESPMRNRLLGKTLTGWAASDPTAAKDFLIQNPAILENRSASQNIAYALGAVDLTAGMAFADKLPEAHRNSFLGDVLSRGAYASPKEASEALIKNPDMANNPEVCSKVADAFYQHNPQAALAWLSTLQGQGRPSATEAVVRVWAGKDATAASSWLASLPPGADRNAGIRSLLEQIKESDPLAAAEWSKELERGK